MATQRGSGVSKARGLFVDSAGGLEGKAKRFHQEEVRHDGKSDKNIGCSARYVASPLCGAGR